MRMVMLMVMRMLMGGDADVDERRSVTGTLAPLHNYLAILPLLFVTRLEISEKKAPEVVKLHRNV